MNFPRAWVVLTQIFLIVLSAANITSTPLRAIYYLLLAILVQLVWIGEQVEKP